MDINTYILTVYDADGNPIEIPAIQGRGIASIVRTSGTGASGTTDTYTITYTDNTTSTFGVYNGKDGVPYTLTSADKAAIAQEAAGLVNVPVESVNGKTGAVKLSASDVGAATSQQVVELSEAKVSKTGITLGLHSDGKYYIFVDGAPVGTGFELSGNSGDVFGYVDENNNIVLNGSLADGSYNIKYEMADGSTVDIGDLVLDSNVYYSVTNTLTNCTNSNKATQIVQGESYSATITANSGHELKSVTVTMGGSPVTVSGGAINITNVTGNIVIVAIAEEIVANYNNLADPTSADWADGKRFNGSGVLVDVDAGVNGATTNYIGGDLTTGDVIRVKGMDLTSYRTVVYDQNKSIVSVATLSGQTPYFENITVNSTGASFTIKSVMSSGGFIRFSGLLNGTSADVIITKNEEIA